MDFSEQTAIIFLYSINRLCICLMWGRKWFRWTEGWRSHQITGLNQWVSCNVKQQLHETNYFYPYMERKKSEHWDVQTTTVALLATQYTHFALLKSRKRINAWNQLHAISFVVVPAIWRLQRNKDTVPPAEGTVEITRQKMSWPICSTVLLNV